MNKGELASSIAVALSDPRSRRLLAVATILKRDAHWNWTPESIEKQLNAIEGLADATGIDAFDIIDAISKLKSKGEQ